MTSDLTEFLLARIAEDEEVARAAVNDLIGDGQDTVTREWFITYDSMNLWPSHLGHIARWDPARVLAECEAKRRIVAKYQQRVERLKDSLYASMRELYENDRSLLDFVLRDLALPYADHPDYRPEWRP